MSALTKQVVLTSLEGRFAETFGSYLEVKRSGGELKACCPFHDDKTPSLCINSTTGLWKCFGCGECGDVFTFVMRKEGIGFPEALARLAGVAGVSPPPSRIVAEYNYTDADGQLLYQVVRMEPKKFFQRRPDGKGGWVKNLKGVQTVLYHLPEVIAAIQAGAPIFIPEGEKDVERMRSVGFTATCNSGGAGKGDSAYSLALRGADLAIFPDNDDVGRSHAEQVARSLHGVAASVRVVHLSGQPEKGDVSDWLDAGGAAEELRRIVQATPLWTPEPPGKDDKDAQGPSEPQTGQLSQVSRLPQISRPPTLHGSALHGLAGDFVRTVEPHTEADPVALLIQFLVTFGSVIGRSAHIKAEWDRHYCNLFAVLIGQSSKARKGTSWGYVKRLFEKVEWLWAVKNIVSGLSSGEGLIYAVRDPVEKDGKDKDGEPTTEIIDRGVEDKRLLVQESEFASVLRVAGRDGNTLSAILRTLWDTGDAQSMTKKDPYRATDAHISIIGHITRDELRKELTSTESANGFGNRFLWFFVRRSKELPEGGSLDEATLSTIIYRLKKAIEFASQADLIKRDEPARQLWCSVYHDLSEGKPGLAGSVTSRAEAQVMRLANVYALLDCCPEIRREHLAAALALWEYAEESARYVFGGSLGDPVADRILDALREAENGLTRTDIRDLFKNNQTAERIVQALALLAEHGRAEFRKMPTGGKPAERWFALRLAEDETPPAPGALPPA